MLYHRADREKVERKLRERGYELRCSGYNGESAKISLSDLARPLGDIARLQRVIESVRCAIIERTLDIRGVIMSSCRFVRILKNRRSSYRRRYFGQPIALSIGRRDSHFVPLLTLSRPLQQPQPFEPQLSHNPSPTDS